MSFTSNTTPVSSCMYSSVWAQRDVQISWIVREADDYCLDQVSAPADGMVYNRNKKDEHNSVSRPLREKNSRKNGGYKHIPHRDKPPQIVARRNARERRRVQAVNSAFLRLRKAVPVENSRGKRISKVKTLQNAIKYINHLQILLQEHGGYEPFNTISNYGYIFNNDNFIEDYEDEI